MLRPTHSSAPIGGEADEAARAAAVVAERAAARRVTASEVADAPDFVEVSKVGSEAFARGNYVEIGIRDNGTFGASAGARPSGYHNPRKSLFGFIANPAFTTAKLQGGVRP